MGMTDRQFDSYQARLLRVIKEILEETDKDKIIGKFEALAQEIEAELKRP
jgi:Txe/YoeB family toxin of Txe-Axe toxin-antitoxin module